MIVITGAAGFIGSCVTAKWNKEGLTNLILVDDFSRADKEPNYLHKSFHQKIDRKSFPEWFDAHAHLVTLVIHLGARTDTTEFNSRIFDELNLEYSKKLWKICSRNNIPMIYASSAATYGLGENGYTDDESKLAELRPLNPYGESKHEFDKWALAQKEKPPHWYGLKFFNVYGPNEYHKGRMASVILHGYKQIIERGEVKLFRSHNPAYKDGEQLRDFVYVKDVVDVIWFLSEKQPASGIYNLGSGEARTFKDLVMATFDAAGKESRINFIDTPEDIRDKYQYYTQADMNKLKSAGYQKKFFTLEEGVRDYVKNYLSEHQYM